MSCDLDDEAVVLSLEGGVYFGLNPVGTRIWRLVQQPRTVREVRDCLVGEYDVDPRRGERDLLAFLGQLVAKGLVTVNGREALP